MKALEIIDELYRHMEWADVAIWNAVLSNDRTAVDGNIRERLHHIHAVQSAYFTIWTGAELEYKDVCAFEDSASAGRSLRSSAKWEASRRRSTSSRGCGWGSRRRGGRRSDRSRHLLKWRSASQA